MIKHYSFGIIPLRQTSQGWKVLLILHQKGHWSFPKGHPEPHELPLETAARELEEETGLKVKAFLQTPPLEERYVFQEKGHLITKTVAYFLAEIEGAISIQEEEVADFRWVSFEEAENLITFKEGKQLCKQIKDYLG